MVFAHLCGEFDAKDEIVFSDTSGFVHQPTVQ